MNYMIVQDIVVYEKLGYVLVLDKVLVLFEFDQDIEQIYYVYLKYGIIMVMVDQLGNVVVSDLMKISQ